MVICIVILSIHPDMYEVQPIIRHGVDSIRCVEVVAVIIQFIVEQDVVIWNRFGAGCV